MIPFQINIKMMDAKHHTDQNLQLPYNVNYTEKLKSIHPSGIKWLIGGASLFTFHWVSYYVSNQKLGF